MRLLPRLIDKAHELGFEIRGGDLFRDPRVHGFLGEKGPKWLRKIIETFSLVWPKKWYGNKYSAHKLKLAIDLNLMLDNALVTTTQGHKQLGEWWERQHALTCWGGRFEDGNHYSITHQGVK